MAVLFALTLTAAFFVAPLYWLFSTAFRRSGSLSVPPELLPTEFTVANIVAIATETPFVDTYFVNSVLISIGTVVVSVTVATMAGYALSRYALPHERAIMLSLLFVQMVPVLALVVPLYRLFSVLGLLDTLTVVVIANTALVVPVATWLIKGYYDTVPPSLEEAARAGGASRIQAFRILLPLGRPAIGAAAVYAFVVSWNQFVFPLTFTSSRAVRPIPVGLYEFISRRGVVQWELLGAASLVAMLPVLLVFLVFQREFVVGLAGSGMRGER